MHEVPGHHAGDVGPELQEEPPDHGAQTEVIPPNTEPTSKRIDNQYVKLSGAMKSSSKAASAPAVPAYAAPTAKIAAV